jgi:TolB-like protein/Tfp pilus assembly protein PilF
LPLPQKPSIAIMPFVNLSGDPAQDYLADGLRLDVQAALVKASGLFLIAPNTVARYRSAEISPEEAGRQMGVRYVLEGAVRRSGQRIRTTVELTDVVARQIVWAEQYDRVLDDGLTVQDEIAAEVLKALDVKLASGERWLLHSTLKSLEALDFFYRGLSRFYAGSKDDNAAAREMFERVARLQPDSAVGPAYLCFTHWVDAFRGWTDSKERSLTQAARWAETAVRHTNSNGLAHIVLASIHLLQRRHDQALTDCYRAVELRPNCPTANSYLANVLHYCGRPAEAVTKLKEAIRITPVYPPWYMSLLAAAYRESGQVAQSITAARHGIRLSPSDPEPRLVLCSDYVLAGQPKQAREVAQEIVAIDPTFSTGRYLARQPYKEERTLQRLADRFREAGLPE